MGVKKLKSDYAEYFVLPKTKNSTFLYKTAFDTAFTYIAGISPKFTNPVTYCYKYKNNLVITAKYQNKTSGKIKTIKTVFKNYFKSNYENKMIFNNYDKDDNPIYQELSDLNLCKNMKGNISDDLYKYLLGSKKSDNYTISSTSGDYIFDEKGKDTYSISNNSALNGEYNYIYDFSGNDKYTVSKDSQVKITDYGGRDTYTITASNAEIVDNFGKDKYILKDNLIGNVTATETKTTILDKKGNDTYELNNFDNLVLTEERGKDRYTVIQSKNIDIADKLGNDSYKIINSDNIKEDSSIQVITDYSGKDSYEINNSKHFIFEDVLGNDRYTISNFSDDITINDNAGSNIYTLKNSSNIHINDKSTSYKTSYNLSATNNSIINDFGGNDGYIISECADITVNDYNIGSDKYNINKYSTFTINDYGISGDSYEISASAGTINDNGGADTYNIKELSKKVVIKDNGGYDTMKFLDSIDADLIFMSDFAANGELSCDMIIYDTKNQGYINVKDFYELNNEGDSYSGINSSKNIEKIYAKKVDITTKVLSCSQLNSINKEQVTAWLSARSFSSVTNALESKPANINRLLQMFSTNAN